MSWEEDFSVLTQLCFRLIESENGKLIPSGGEWKNDAQVIATKIFWHLASARHLSNGEIFEFEGVRPFPHVDHSSVAIVMRAAVEAYLTFHYVFINQDESVSVYRHKIWKLGGLVDRSKFFANTPESVQKLAVESLAIDQLRIDIQSDTNFNIKKSKNLLQGKWREDIGWTSLASLAGFHEVYFKDIYNHLCGHAHASFISALQIRDAYDIESQRMLAGSIRQIGCLLMAHFAFSYVQLFPGAQKALHEDKVAFETASTWNIQKEDSEFIYGKTVPK
ncbi:DUF5677 domain-containing protein [Pseudomonas sp. Irchel s3h9]|jgi:hypothetical protein|uniref:DUF5677 domain-containing protein n=1 Tax=Pseudomonas sp. Irchel s3h9 TaxID=2009192 RepID=UPI000BA2E98E|nr:DUF5677 domain-containing protein [Pseudomonas sp. Irchel s3h9]